MRVAKKLDIACPNVECRTYNRIGLLNVIRKGTQRNGTLRYQCTECKRTFARTIGTPFFRKHLKKQAIKNICKHLVEKNSYRSIARITGHHLDTIRSVADAVGNHCEQYNQLFIKELKLTPIEIDEMWSFVKKKEENCLNNSFRLREIGDTYTYIGLKRETTFLICSVVGKWNELTCNDFYQKLASRLQLPTRKYRLDIFTDGNKQNITGIQTHFPRGSVNYGMKKKIRQGTRIVGIVTRKVLGNPSRGHIAINNIDGMCSKLRERVSCFTRKARTFAKRKRDLEYRLEIFSTQHNFIEKKYGVTPAMQEGIIQRVLNWSAILHTRLSILN